MATMKNPEWAERIKKLWEESESTEAQRTSYGAAQVSMEPEEKNEMNAITRAGFLVVSNDFEAARAAAEADIARDPQSAGARLNLAASLDGLGATDAALEVQRAAIRADGESWEACYVHGVQLAGVGRLGEAYWSLRNAIARGGSAPEVYAALVGVLERMDRLPEAIDTAIRAVGANPENADCHYQLGRLMARNDKWDLAALSLEECLRVATGALGSRWGKLGAVYYMLGRYSDADTAFGTSDRLEPGALTAMEVELWRTAQQEME